MATKKRNGAGRPPIEIDWKLVEQFATAGCSGVEIAGHLGVHYDTLYNRCEKKFGIKYTEYSQQFKEKGKALIKFAQFQKAITEKNPTMLIWLGKQYLGQRETIEHHHDGDIKINGLDF